MDLANTLVRSVARAFYDTRHILIIDALFRHSVLHVEDLAVLLSIQTKDLRKLCGRLKEDRMIAIASRLESRDGISRPVNREYYYIPLHPVIDTIKFRISRLTSTIKAQYTPSQERKEYVCMKCKADYATMDVIDSVGPDGLICKRCGHLLTDASDIEGGTGADRTGHEKNAKLMAQLDKWLKLLQKIDSVEVPQNDFDTAWEHKIEAPRDKTVNPLRQSVAVASSKANAVSGIRTSKVDESALKISVASTEEMSVAEKAEAEARKAAFEKQNALPVWHTESTVATGVTSTSIKTDPTSGLPVKSENGDADIKPDISKDQMEDEMAAYYAQLAREKEIEAMASTPEEDSSDEEEEEDEFEDVASGGSTPKLEVPVKSEMTAPSPGMLNGGSSLKRELSADGFGGDGDMKRVKIEDTGMNGNSGVKAENGDSEEDDDDDFEDV